MSAGLRALLETLFGTAVNAAHPADFLPRHLPPPPPAGRLLILAAGKAAGSRTEVGGPNQEYALALAVALAGETGVAALAGDTDGTDGGGGRPEDPAGAAVDQTTLRRAGSLGLDPAHFLNDNNSTEFFERLGDLFKLGPTFTNVNDFRAIVVDNS